MLTSHHVQQMKIANAYRETIRNDEAQKNDSTICYISINCNVQSGLFQSSSFFMAAIWNRAGHYISALWFLLSFHLLFFLA